MKGDLTERRLPRPAEPVWRSYVEQWDRSLRAANKPLTTRYNYELAVVQLAEFLSGDEMTTFLASSGLVVDDVSDAAEDPTDVHRGHVEVFIAWMIETRSASTAVNKHKSAAAVLQLPGTTTSSTESGSSTAATPSVTTPSGAWSAGRSQPRTPWPR